MTKRITNNKLVVLFLFQVIRNCECIISKRNEVNIEVYKYKSINQKLNFKFCQVQEKFYTQSHINRFCALYLS